MSKKQKVKLIILTEDDNSIPKEAISMIGRDKFWFINTRGKFGEREYRFLESSIEGFNRTAREVMVAKFSGREDIAKRLGDERSEIIVHLRNDYSDIQEYTETFSNLLKTFYKETV